MPDKCPWCGVRRYRTDVPDQSPICGSTARCRDEDCYERQIARLQNELIEAVAMRHGTDGLLARMQPVVDAAIIYRNIGTSGTEDDFFNAVDKYKEVE